MCKFDVKLCKICLRNSENCKVINASSYNNIFSQLLGVKFYSELWLCIWCAAILERTAHLQRIAVESQKILNKCTNLPARIKANIHPYTLTYHKNPNIDISHNQIDNNYEDPPDAELKNEFDDTNHLEDCNKDNFLEDDNTTVEMSHRNQTAGTIKEEKNVKKKNAEFFKALGFEVEYLSVKEQKDEMENMKVSSKYLDMKYKCNDCAIGFMIEDDFEEHVLKHKPEHGPHVCSICKLRYKSREVLWQHTLAHSRRFTCVNCSGQMKRANRHRCEFSNAYSLINVKRTQNNERKYVCHQCNKKFASKQRLKIHSRSHTGSQPYQCTTCSRSFSTKSNLRAHAAVHSENKPFYCVECNTYYKTEKSLKRHFALSTRHIKSEDMAYACSECTKRFTSDKCLQYHIKVRHNTSYKCSYCDKNFYNNANLKKHIRCIHSEIK